MAELTAKELSRRGGNRTKERYGIDFYREIGKKGGQRTKELYRDKFKDWGSLGSGRPRKLTLSVLEGEKAKNRKEVSGASLSFSPSAM